MKYSVENPHSNLIKVNNIIARPGRFEEGCNVGEIPVYISNGEKPVLFGKINSRGNFQFFSMFSELDTVEIYSLSVLVKYFSK